VEEELDDGTRALREALAVARQGRVVLVRGAAPDALADLARRCDGADVALVVALGDEPVPDALAGLPVFEAAPAGGAARARRRRGLVELRCGAPGTACELLVGAAALLGRSDPAAALRTLADAAAAASYAGDLHRVAAIGRQAQELDLSGTGTPETLRVLTYLRGMGRMAEADAAGAAPLLGEVMAAGRRAGDAGAVLQGAIAATTLGADGAARALAARAVERARAAGEPGLLARTLESLVYADLLHGRYDAAARHALEGRRLADEAGHLTTGCQHMAGLALIAAFRGRPAAAREHAVVALEHARAHRVGLSAATAAWALGIADISEDRPDDALDRLEALAGAGPGHGHPLIARLAAPHLAEAAALTGEPRRAAAALDGFARFARHGGQLWAEGLVARAQGLTATGRDADAHFGRALVLHAQAGRHFDLARTELVWGQALRRAGRLVEAAAHLRAALDALDRLGGGSWADRARAELRATGERAHSRGAPGAADRLTPREHEIVALVSTGATNREIAAQLELSPRTVDHHLRQVFAKLGISSRAELIPPRA
jgi:DNA-binding CsgD family transcriptional regulator